MAMQLSDLLEQSSARLGGVHPRIREYALELVRRSYSKGINVIITSGLRSMEGQAKLYGQGRTSYIYKGTQYGNPKLPLVTHAPPGQSIHNHGLAIDFALRTENGQIVWDLSRDVNGNGVKDWFEVAAIGKQMGFAWGGDWKNFKDYPHLDMQKGITLAQLNAGVRPNIPPLPVKDWHEMGDTGPEVMAIQTKLKILGFRLELDGIWGPALEAAVRTYQGQNRLEVDGLFGKMTEALLDKQVAAKQKAEAEAAAKIAADKKAAAAAIAKAKAAAEKALAEAEAKTAAEKPAPIKGGADLNMAEWQRNELMLIFKKARESGLFDSDEHEQKILDDEMPMEMLVFLLAAIVGTLINNGERLR